ncbi:Aste57867_24747 [Aphanomyces stellatus]|uniref:NADPH--hemoprotein reductase n=1 Tax=Aphanomyces stellatus TaxID=120398 RepID=A0A485LVI3_9STRA|nr:hypothetical protein As57867_024669 [Aphanomyces stellatus]VFU01383.1 Aste57867_24747 [Aphanomyces stellatus]
MWCGCFRRRVQSTSTAADNPAVVIYYGTQSGGTEQLATRLSRQLAASALSLADFEFAFAARHRHVIFMCATYGKGGPTDDAKEFLHWLTESTAADLGALHYAVFGAGSSDYPDTFNGMAKKVDATLAARGAKSFLPLTLGDAGGMGDKLETDYLTWEPQVLAVLKATAATHTGDERAELRRTSTARAAVLAQPPTLELLVIRPLSPTAVHVEFALPPSVSSYRGADTLFLYPQNTPAVVAAVAAHLGINDLAAVEPTFKCSAREALTHHVDLFAVSRDVLTSLAAHATDAVEAARLRHLGSLGGSADLASVVRGPRLSLLGVLKLFPSVRPSLSNFLRAATPMKPRQYTIASSPLVHAAAIHICVSIPPAAESFDRHFGTMGACLRALVDAHAGRVLFHGSPKPSTFAFPDNPKRPVVMIAAGAGIAPMRAIWQERAAVKRRGSLGGPSIGGPMLLFFGCRDQDNYLYADEIARQEGLTTHAVFSRTLPKQYVQDCVRDHLGEIIKLQDAVVYLCGRTDMALAIQNVFKTDAPAWWDTLQASNRFNQEVFG